MSLIFISYRRDDCAETAEGLFDELSAYFGREQVFMDIRIDPGDDFNRKIEDALDSATVLLAVVGPRWLGILDERRRMHEADYTRLEIRTALDLGVRVVPVLVGGAARPRLVELPLDLRDLASRTMHELRSGSWEADLRALKELLDRELPVPVAPPVQKKGRAPVVLPWPGEPPSAPWTPFQRGLSTLLRQAELEFAQTPKILRERTVEGDEVYECPFDLSRSIRGRLWFESSGGRSFTCSLLPPLETLHGYEAFFDDVVAELPKILPHDWRFEMQSRPSGTLRKKFVAASKTRGMRLGVTFSLEGGIALTIRSSLALPRINEMRLPKEERRRIKEHHNLRKPLKPNEAMESDPGLPEPHEHQILRKPQRSKAIERPGRRTPRSRGS